MQFDTFIPRMVVVARAALKFCTDRYGKSGLKIEEQINPDISWQPTFYLRPATRCIIAAEVHETLYPEILKIAAHDIRSAEIPISVYLVCPLEVYLADSSHSRVNLLKRDGFGIITVDDSGIAVQQYPCIPLAQHISAAEIEREIRGLTPRLKSAIRRAHDVYLNNEGQGLQEAGQIVEAVIFKLATESVRKQLVVKSKVSGNAADVIDELYGLQSLRQHRAALGGARDFVKEYRNTASHAPRSGKQAMEKIRKCRNGFIDAIRITRNLRAAMKTLGMRITIHVT